MRRADIAAPLSEGMSRLDANHASVSDPLFLLFLFLILGPPWACRRELWPALVQAFSQGDRVVLVLTIACVSTACLTGACEVFLQGSRATVLRLLSKGSAGGVG